MATQQPAKHPGVAEKRTPRVRGPAGAGRVGLDLGAVVVEVRECQGGCDEGWDEDCEGCEYDLIFVLIFLLLVLAGFFFRFF